MSLPSKACLSLAINLQLLVGDLERFDALVQLREELLDLGDDAVLFVDGGQPYRPLFENTLRYFSLHGQYPDESDTAR